MSSLVFVLALLTSCGSMNDAARRLDEVPKPDVPPLPKPEEQPKPEMPPLPELEVQPKLDLLLLPKPEEQRKPEIHRNQRCRPCPTVAEDEGVVNSAK
jgi:hypothetical protein